MLNTKNIAVAIGIYLVVVGGATYISESSSSSPTADKLAAWPSLGSAILDVGAGVALIMFAPRIAHAV